MSIISISRSSCHLGSYHRGNEVAQKVAEILGYACISRAVVFPCFQSAEVKAALFDFPTTGGFVDAGRAHIHVKALENQSAAISARIEKVVGGIEGLAALEIRIAPYY